MRPEDNVSIGGVLRPRIYVPREHYDRIEVSGLVDVREELLADGRVLVIGERHNAFVNTGLELALNRLFGIPAGSVPGPLTHMAVSADDQAVTAATALIDPAGGAAGSTFVALQNVARTNQTVSCEGAYSQANVSFAIKKVGLLNTATDAGTGLLNVIGGSGGSAPYNEPFTIDLTGAATWDLVLQLDVTAQAT